MQISQFQNRNILMQAERNGWRLLPFNELLKDDTKFATKIKKEDYLLQGKYPVIDQGKVLIGGYSDDESGVYKEQPFIIFGDHTRILKYIDFSSFIGADGVKLLKNIYSEDEVITKYLFYFLTTIDIPNTGYNRHFKYLKEVVIPLPSIEIQSKIVQILDKTSLLIEKRRAQIKSLHALTQSIFFKMFGNPVKNNKRWKEAYWEEVFHTKTGKLNANAMVENGEFPFFTCSKEIYNIDTFSFNQEALILTGNNAVGNYDVKYYNGKFDAYQRTYILSLIEENNKYNFFKVLLESKLKLLQKNSIGSNTKYLTMQILKEIKFIIPPEPLQIEFVRISKEIETQKYLMEKNLKELELSFNSLLHRAFKGDFKD